MFDMVTAGREVHRRFPEAIVIRADWKYALDVLPAPSPTILQIRDPGHRQDPQVKEVLPLAVFRLNRPVWQIADEAGWMLFGYLNFSEKMKQRTTFKLDRTITLEPTRLLSDFDLTNLIPDYVGPVVKRRWPFRGEPWCPLSR